METQKIITSPTYDNLGESGYRIVKGVLSEKKCQKLSDSIYREIIDLVFIRQGHPADPDDPDTPRLLVDQKFRVDELGEEAKRCPWRNGNTLTPIFTKSTGMIHSHFNPDILEGIIFNEELYKISAEINGTDKLAFITGPERVSLKPKGATDMPQHIDSNLFNNKVNYPFRIQSLITLQIDTEINPRDSGTFCVIPYFQHYWEFASHFFHPATGHPSFRFPKNTSGSRFFKLPTGKEGFDKKYLPHIKRYASIYADYLEKGEAAFDYYKVGPRAIQNCIKFFQTLIRKGIAVPSNSKGYIKKMKWTPIKLEPGDILYWHQHLPHRSLRNKSDIPRIVAYYNLFPVDENWFGSKEQKWVARQFRRGEFYYGTDYGNYPTKIVNIEEHKKLIEESKIEEIAEISKKTELRKKLSGQKNWH